MIPQKQAEKIPWVSAEEIADYVYCPERWRLRAIAQRKKVSDTQRLKVISKEQLTNSPLKQAPIKKRNIGSSLKYIIALIAIIALLAIAISLLGV